jgi:hypothetical protein
MEQVVIFSREVDEMLIDIEAPVSRTIFIGLPPMTMETTKEPPTIKVGMCWNPDVIVS